MTVVEDTKRRRAARDSWRKWVKITQMAEPSRATLGSADCALCRLYNSGINWSISYADTCTECPVYEKTGMIHCRNTPYSDFADWYSEKSSQPDEEFGRELAQSEVEFLEKFVEFVKLGRGKYTGRPRLDFRDGRRRYFLTEAAALEWAEDQGYQACLTE